MKATELREKSVSELSDELLSLRKAQFSLRLQGAVGEGVRPHEPKALRRDIARVKTVLHQKQGAGE